MATEIKIDRSELAIWAEGTPYSTDDLVGEYRAYCEQETEAGRDPLNESRWANTVKGIANCAVQHGVELTKLIADRGGEEPEQIGHGVAPTGGDGFTLFRFSDGTEVIETNAGLVNEDDEGFAGIKHCCTND